MQTNCETCCNYIYDEDLEYYFCNVNLDQDELRNFISGVSWNCPYYQSDNEYDIVKKQM